MESNSRYTERMVSEIINKNSSDFGKRGHSVRTLKLAVPLASLKKDDEVICGSSISYPDEVMQDLRLICFECSSRFNNLKGKFNHMKQVHLKAPSKLCRTCFCATNNPDSHTITIVKNLGPLFASSSGSTNAGVTKAMAAVMP